MKNKTISIILIFILVIMLGIGITYAYFSARITGNENASTLSLEAGELEIDVDGGNIITASKFLPDSNIPFATKTITLTGKNTSIYLNMPYTIKLVVDNNTFTAGSIKYSISGVNNANSGKVIPDIEMKDGDSTETIGSGYFERGNYLIHTYTLKVYFPETGTDQSENMKAIYSAHIEVTGEEAEEPAPKGWWKAKSGTLLAAIRDNSTLHIDETGMTKPGTDIATTDEQLRITTDDYGVSFYYRGAVENNYVIFANKCWKIVRVDGNGNIKLFLWNNDNDCTTNNTNSLNSPFNNGTYLRYIDNLEKSVSNAAAGIGFMYGKPDSTNVFTNNNVGTQDNITDSTILSALKTWYDNTFNTDNSTSYTDLLADTIWCGDKSFSDGPGYGQNTDDNLANTYFGAYKRLINTQKSPSLICPNISITNGISNKIKNISKFTANTANDTSNGTINNAIGNGMLKTAITGTYPLKYKYYKIGLITADEFAFAGGVYNTANSSHYLNATSNYWTLSPFSFSGTYALIFYVNSTGSLIYNHSHSNYNLRPAISLNYNVLATYNALSEYNPGTVNNPYVVTITNE